MDEKVTDISNILFQLHSKLSSLEQAVCEQGTEINRLNRIMSLKDKELHALKSENRDLKNRLYGYEKPDKDSRNSSIPPSQESIRSKAVRRTRSLRKKSDRKSGGQPGHPGSTLETCATPEIIVNHEPHYCERCGEPLCGTTAVCTGTSQVIDIPLPAPRVTKHRSYEKTCSCGHLNQCSLPPACSKRISYGDGIRSLIGYLCHVQCIPFKRLCDTLHDIFSLRISEGTIRNILCQIGEKSRTACEEIRKRIENSSVAGADETGEFVNGELHWGWIFQTPKLTYAYRDKSGGMKAIEKHFKNDLPNATLVTDRHASYFNMNVKGHQVCPAHLLRNLQYLDELDTGQDWSKRTGTLLREAIHQHKSMAFKEIPVKAIKEKPDRLLTECLSHLHEDFQVFKKGKRI